MRAQVSSIYSQISHESYPNEYMLIEEVFCCLNESNSILSPPRKKYFGYIVQWMIGGTRGGLNRARIINKLSIAPMNAHQLSKELSLDYSTIRHHLEVMEKNGIVASLGEGYGMAYLLSETMLEHYDIFEEIWDKIGNKGKNDDMEDNLDEGE